MIFSYSTNAFVKYTATEALALIAGSGFGGVELMCDRPHLYPPDVTPEAVADLKQALETHELAITNLNCFTLFAVGNTHLPSWIEPDPERRQTRIGHTLNCLKLARELGAGCISVPPGGPLGGMDRTAASKLFYQGLESVLPLAQELDVAILIEPEPDLMIETSSQMQEFIRDIASAHLGVNFDVGHFYCVGEAPEEALETLFDRVGHIHIEDIAASREHHHLIPGRGAIDFERFFETLKALGYDGGVCLELYPYTENPEEAGSEGFRHLKPIMERCGF